MFVSNRSVGYFDILGLITYNEQHALVVKITDTNWINQDFGNLYFNYTIVKEKTDFEEYVKLVQSDSLSGNYGLRNTSLRAFWSNFNTIYWTRDNIVDITDESACAIGFTFDVILHVGESSYTETVSKNTQLSVGIEPEVTAEVAKTLSVTLSGTSGNLGHTESNVYQVTYGGSYEQAKFKTTYNVNRGIPFYKIEQDSITGEPFSSSVVRSKLQLTDITLKLELGNSY